MKSERINLRVTKSNKARLAKLARLSGCTSMTDVVTKALAFWEVFLLAREDGKELILRSSDGKSEEKMVIL